MVIRAGTIVKLNAEGRKEYPEFEFKTGELEGFNQPHIARVKFTGLAPVVMHDTFLEPTVSQPPKKERWRRSAADLPRHTIVENRKIVRLAFDLVRHDPAEKATAMTFSGVLGGRIEMTDSILESARQVIAERSH